MKNILFYAVLIIAVMTFSYGMYRLEKWINYNRYYKYRVTEQVQPLVDRINSLEKRIEQLEKK